uniref:Uncharacterized protein n=1 Tax=Lepeophtheirus salmonis TaxID=72036 RepID=A0A0K2UP28_LEPSM
MMDRLISIIVEKYPKEEYEVIKKLFALVHSLD